MKKLKYFTVLFMLMISANAQIAKGNWMMGGDASFTYQKIESKNLGTETGITYNSGAGYTVLIEPNLGYFVSNKFAFGAKIYYINYYSERDSLDILGGNFSIGPYVRYYLLDEEKQFNLFIEPSYYFFTNKYSGNTTGFGVKAGTVIFLNSSVGLETALSYNTTSSYNNNFKSLFFGFGLQIHLEKNN